jgi:hypothetical protein
MAYYFGSLVLIVSGLILLPFSRAIQMKTTEIEVTVVDNSHNNYIRDEGLFEYSYIWHRSLTTVFSWYLHTLERRLPVWNRRLNCPYVSLYCDLGHAWIVCTRKQILAMILLDPSIDIYGQLVKTDNVRVNIDNIAYCIVLVGIIIILFNTRFIHGCDFFTQMPL